MNNFKNQTVCLTGHRPKGLPWGYDEEKDICKKFKKHLRKTFRKIIKKGFTNFYTGMAEGFDMIATEILISLKRKHKINIWAAVPCKNQEAKWKLSQQERYHNILKECDKIIILSGVVSKKRYTKTFFNTLLEWTDLDKLNADLERKIDEKGNWFLRFDKVDAFDEKWTILDSGDSIHLKVKIAAYPAKKQIAVDKVREAIE